MSIHRRPDGKPGYYVRYRDPSGRQREAWGPAPGQTFTRKLDAERFEAALRTDMHRGQWRDPRAQKLKLGELVPRWLDTKRDRNTRAWNENVARYVLARWEHAPVASLNFLDIQAWVNELEEAEHGPDTVRGAFRALHEVVKVALRMRALQFDPCEGVVLPKVSRREMLFLTPTQLDLLATTLDDEWPGFAWGLLVRFAAYSGCRAGEVGGLQVKHLDLLHHRARIERARKTYGEFGPTKVGKPRWVDLPRQLCHALDEFLVTREPAADDLVWTGERGGPLSHHWFYGHRFKPTVQKLSRQGRLPTVEVARKNGAAKEYTLRFHDLRHTCVAFLIGQGAQQYEVMEHLGHTKIQTTIDTYGHLFPNVRARIRTALEETWDEGIAGAAAR